jgi:hypothetical protein
MFLHIHIFEGLLCSEAVATKLANVLEEIAKGEKKKTRKEKPIFKGVSSYL